MRKKKFTGLKIVLGILLGLFLIDLATNKLVNTDISDLSRIDRAVTNEYEKFQESDEKLWQDYELRDKDIVVINKKFLGNTYLLTKDSKINQFLQRKFPIKMIR